MCPVSILILQSLLTRCQTFRGFNGTQLNNSEGFQGWNSDILWQKRDTIFSQWFCSKVVFSSCICIKKLDNGSGWTVLLSTGGHDTAKQIYRRIKTQQIPSSQIHSNTRNILDPKKVVPAEIELIKFIFRRQLSRT